MRFMALARRQIVEAYFHPVTSRLVRQNIAH